ncbi:MAG: response regulator transcription factor [Chloroflexota bacterium]|nr:response regulator transcription factor [Chloroflexota bacterium]
MNIAHDKSNELSRDDITRLLKEESITPIFVYSVSDIDTLKDRADSADYTPLVLIYLARLKRTQVSSVLDQCKSNNISTLAIVSTDDLISLDIEMDINDFIVDPFDEEELLVRSIFSVRRSKARPNEDEHIIRGDLTINPSNYEVLINNNRINLRFKEYELLLLLASNPGRVYDRATLLNQIWGYDYFGGTRTVDVHIRRLRSKIEINSENPYIETIWNVGYRFRSSD